VKTEQLLTDQKTYTYSQGDISVSNERNFTTRYDFDRYGDPDEGFLKGIVAPESSASITMSRNEIGILLSATQNGVTRTYGRNSGSGFFLTSISEPETTGTMILPSGVL